jgi:hypothetical protein
MIKARIQPEFWLKQTKIGATISCLGFMAGMARSVRHRFRCLDLHNTYNRLSEIPSSARIGLNPCGRTSLHARSGSFSLSGIW